MYYAHSGGLCSHLASPMSEYPPLVIGTCLLFPLFQLTFTHDCEISDSPGVIIYVILCDPMADHCYAVVMGPS